MGFGFNVKSLNLRHYSHVTQSIFSGSHCSCLDVFFIIITLLYCYNMHAMHDCPFCARDHGSLSRSVSIVLIPATAYDCAATPLPLLLIRGMQFNILHDSHSDAGFRTFFFRNYIVRQNINLFSLFCININGFYEVIY